MANLMLNPTVEDYQKLWELNPLAESQLKNIVLARMLNTSGEERALLRKEIAELELAATPKVVELEEVVGPVPATPEIAAAVRQNATNKKKS